MINNIKSISTPYISANYENDNYGFTPYILCFLVISFSIITISIEQYLLTHLSLIISCLILLINNRKALILLYIIYFPTNGFIGTEHNLLGILHTSYTINTFAFVAIILETRHIKNHKTLKSDIDIIGKNLYPLVIFIFLYLFLRNYRLYFSASGDISTLLLITRSIRHIVQYIPLLFLIELISSKQYRRLLFNGYLIGIIIISLSILFSEYLFKFGVNIGGELEDTADFVRHRGVFGMGNVNAAAAYLSVAFAFVCFIRKGHIKTAIKYIILLVILTGILFTASRSAVIAVFLVLLFYAMSSFYVSFKSAFYSFITITSIILFALITGYFEPVFERLLDLQLGEGHLDAHQELSRVGGWLFYSRYIFSNINVFLFGQTETIYESLGMQVGRQRGTHNLFINMIFNWGVFSFLIFVSIIYKTIKNTKVKYCSIHLLALIIAMVTEGMSSHSLTPFTAFTLSYMVMPKDYEQNSFSYSKVSRLSI